MVPGGEVRRVRPMAQPPRGTFPPSTVVFKLDRCGDIALDVGKVGNVWGGRSMHRPSEWVAIYPQLADRVRVIGFVDPTILEEAAFATLPKVHFRDSAQYAAAYIARLSRRKLLYEEYMLVLMLAENLGICYGFYPDVLSDAEKTAAERHLSKIMEPLASWVEEDLAAGPYAWASSIWPLSAIYRK